MSASTSKGISGRKGMKLKSLSLQDKLKVLARIDAGASMRSVCAEFDIKSSTFYDIKNVYPHLGHVISLSSTL